MSSPVAQVLDNAELREAILLQCEMRDLIIHLPLVNRSYRDAIAASSRLQQRLHFRAVPPAATESNSTCSTESAFRPHVHNPLLTKIFKPWFQNEVTLEHLEAWWKKKTLAERAALLRADASWRRMLVCQPAIHTLEKFQSISSRGNSGLRSSLTHEDGVRMGSFYDLTEDTTKSSHNINILWPTRDMTRLVVAKMEVFGCCVPWYHGLGIRFTGRELSTVQAAAKRRRERDPTIVPHPAGWPVPAEYHWPFRSEGYQQPMTVHEQVTPELISQVRDTIWAQKREGQLASQPQKRERSLPPLTSRELLETKRHMNSRAWEMKLEAEIDL